MFFLATNTPPLLNPHLPRPRPPQVKSVKNVKEKCISKESCGLCEYSSVVTMWQKPNRFNAQAQS